MPEKILHVIYRISDKGNPKSKLANASKLDCLTNAVQEFGAENFHVIADNCADTTLDVLKSADLDFEITANGNAGTCRYIFEEVINRYAPEDFLYLLEDDYLHLPGSRQALSEGLEIADYVTLYDHPDMYHPDGKGMNPFVHDDFPKCSIYLTAHTHWRSTVSTTMTFAARVKTLIEDREVWKLFSKGTTPHDFFSFIMLTGQDDMSEARRVAKRGEILLARIIAENFFLERKKRLLISPMPSFATHVETKFLAPLIDWTKV
ncbi:MAG: hypothetical protein IKP64_01215 [Selenomonadaceae bacterium]|nr:hypothetical protein [Selenomonadaceae bacterium]MBR4382157.1 hypothetical protein [Selenomonadaceae bacterium]